MLIDAQWNIDRNACYIEKRLQRLYDRPMSLREVLTRRDGEWAYVSDADRVWVACRALPDREARLFACDCAEHALLGERAAGRVPDPRCWAAIEVSRRFAVGATTTEVLAAARSAAWSAAGDAAWSAAGDAARSAAWSAARSAAWSAAGDAARSAAGDARAWQIQTLLTKYVPEGQ